MRTRSRAARIALRGAAIAAALFLWSACFVGRVLAQDEFQLEIRTGTLTRIPIHIESFLYESGTSPIRFELGETPEDLLERDLTYSSFFRVSRGPMALPGPGLQDPLLPAGVRSIASATIRLSWGRILLTGNLRDGTSGTRIFTKDYALGDTADRWAVHAFADDIVLYMTGERGVAQTRIAFVREHGTTREIHLIDYDGVGEEQLTKLSTLVLSPDWAPGGDRLAFTSFGGGEAAVVGLGLRDGKYWRVSPGGGMSASASWSPDGKRIAFTRSMDGNSEIFIADSDGGSPARLTFSPSIDTSPCFSPDGGQIAFTSDRSGNPQVYVMDRGGGNVRRISFVGKQSDSPDWSPKGDRIAYVCLLDGVFDICTMRVDGSGVQRLTSNEGMHENPRWAADGRHLVYSKLQGGERRIHVMASDGSGKRVLTGGRGGQYNPAWSPALSLQSVRGLGRP
ncbi:MAG: Tol-Pal system beta propeller repeat protein TolB [Candidatus Eisenbacteria bacterium]|nr:Tol-Pal system beta propeller repeat protein TolB [Candidatus Eisenbacteria bacterium]